MADHAYAVEVQSDFLEKITRAKPVQALAEMIWNGLDADATSVDVPTLTSAAAQEHADKIRGAARRAPARPSGRTRAAP